MGLHDHRQRIARLVGGPPPLVPEEISYLENALGDPHRVRFFAELADRQEWLSWAAQRPQFQAMFRADAPYDTCTVVLSNWFVERFVMEESRTAEALAVLHDGGGLPAPVLCTALGQQPGIQQADVTVTGPARSLLLALTRRLPLTDHEATNISVDGDTGLAQHWIDSTAHVAD
jgi:hypothetical protein